MRPSVAAVRLYYIIGEKLRGDSAEARAGLARQGRYHRVAGNLEVTESR